MEDLTYRITFDERDAQGKQRFVVRRIAGAEAANPHAPGEVVAHGSTDETVTAPSGLRVWAGQAGDPFWIEPDVPHTVGHAFQDGTPAVFGVALWNGRTMTDNAPDVMFTTAANTPISLGIGKESVTSKPSSTFPYVPKAHA